MTDTKIAEKTETTEKTRADDTKTQDKAKLFNLTQIAGGALAAVTTAAVGSRLGVAGTLVGAGIASVLAAFASTLYTRGLERTREGVKKIVLRDATGNTEVFTVPDEGGDESSLQQTAIAAPSAAQGGTRQHGGWRRPLAIAGGMAITAAATFVVAMGVVTGWEFSTGQTLDGRSGTTIGQARQSSTKPTPTATPTATATPTSSATPTATETPTATPTAPSVTPTPTPTPSATTTDPSATPADAGQGAIAG